MAEQNKLTIQTLQRHTDWLAYVNKPFRDYLWEAAPTREKAIEKLRDNNPDELGDAEVENK